jgi:hypothetical protein
MTTSSPILGWGYPGIEEDECRYYLISEKM